MAITKLHQQSESSTAWAEEVAECEAYADEIEDFLRHTRSVLLAIDVGEMLSDSWDTRNAAAIMLDQLARQLKDLESKPRTDLSIKLRHLKTRVAAFEG